MIPYGRQEISDDDIAAVVAVLRSDWLTQGPADRALRAGGRRLLRRAHAVAVATRPRRCTSPAWRSASGRATRSGPRRTPSSPRPIARCYCGAGVDFVDIDPRTLQPERRSAGARSLEARQRRAGCRRSWCPVHFAGQSCDMRASARWPSATASASSRTPRTRSAALSRAPVGSCHYLRHDRLQLPPGQDRHHRRGRHGAHQRSELAERLRLLRTHGITRATAEDRDEQRNGAQRPVVLRAGRARLQLPHDRPAGGARRQPDGAARPVRRAPTRLAARYDGLLAELPLRARGSTPDVEFGLPPVRDPPAPRRDQASHREVFDALRAAASASTCITFRCTPSRITGSSVSRPAVSRGRTLLRRGDHLADVFADDECEQDWSSLR